jgi:hypothetical protein
MKKVLLSLLAVAALVLSCQNYDDEFAALNSKVASLESQISSLAGLQTALTQVQSSVSALQAAVSAIPNLSSEVAAILADLSDLETAVSGATTSADLDALKAELNTTLAALQALIEANSSDIASVVAANAELKSQLEALGVDVDAVLAQNSTYTGNVTITNAAEMAFAQSLGSKVAVINGNVKIQITKTNGVTVAGVNEVSKLIKTVVGNVTVETNASIDMSALTSVSGDYVVDGFDISDDALVSAGDILLDYDGGYTLPALTTAKNIYLVDYDTTAATSSAAAIVGTISVAFNTALQATSISTAASGSVHSGGGGHSSGGSFVVGSYTANTVNFNDASSIVIGDVPVISVTAPDATSLELHYDGAKTDQLASLTVVGAKLTSVTTMATYITGVLDIDGAATAAFSAPSLVEVGGATDIDAATVSFPVAAKLDGAVALPNVTSLSLPAATATGDITAAKAKTIAAGKLVDPVLADIAAGATIELASIDETYFTVAADLADVVSLKLNALSANILLDLSSAADLVSADISGKANTANVTIADNELLTTLSFGGKLGTVTVGDSSADGLAKLTTFTTSGTIKSLVVQRAKALTSIAMGHTEDAADGSSLTVTNNDKLTALTTSFNRATGLSVTDNETLASLDFSSFTTVPNDFVGTTAVSFTVIRNYKETGSGTTYAVTGMTGSYTALTATTDEKFTQAGLATLAPYILLDTGVAGTRKFTATINLDYVVTAEKTVLASSTAGGNISTLAEVKTL